MRNFLRSGEISVSWNRELATKFDRRKLKTEIVTRRWQRPVENILRIKRFQFPPLAERKREREKEKEGCAVKFMRLSLTLPSQGKLIISNEGMVKARLPCTCTFYRCINGEDRGRQFQSKVVEESRGRLND